MARFSPWGTERPDSQNPTAWRVTRHALAMSARVKPDFFNRVMAFMVTHGNPYFSRCQLRVTGCVGNLLFPLAAIRRQSHSMQPIFSIIKAEALRTHAGNPSYAAIAAAMGLKSRQAVGHWFRGRGEPDVQQMKKMAAILHCHWLELVTDETKVLFRQEDIDRQAKIDSLTNEARAELDAFLAFKTTR